MNQRVLATAFAATLMLPAGGSGQGWMTQDEPVLSPYLRITPFVGYLPSFVRLEDWSHAGSTFVQSEVTIAGGPATGIAVEAPLYGRFGLTAAALFGSRDATVFEVLETGEEFLLDGSRVILGRVGVMVGLTEDPSELVLRRLNASVFAGVTVLHERPRNEFGTAEFMDSGTHLGGNLGVVGELPFAGDRFAIQAAIEDHIMYWREGPLKGLAAEYFLGPREDTRVSTNISHTWLLRAGVSMRL